MFWLGVRQLVATVMLSLAGLQPVEAQSTDAPRYEVEMAIRVDTKNQGLSATTLRLLQMRVHATAALGSRGLGIVMLPDLDDPVAHKIIVRGTTVPRLLERLITARTICGWSRDAMEDSGRRKARHTTYDEMGPMTFARWGASDMAQAYLEEDSDERAVLGVSLGRDGADDLLLLSLEEPGPDHRELVVAGMVVPEEDIQARPLVGLALPQSPEEQAAIVGLIRLAPQTLPQAIVVNDVQIRPLDADGTPPTITRRMAAARTASPEQLLGLLADRSPLVRRRAVLAAIDRGAKARKVLERGAHDGDPMVAAPAATALLQARVRLPEQLLWRLAASPSFDAAKPALEALMRSGPDGHQAALKAFRDERRLAAALPEIQRARFRPARVAVDRLASRAASAGVRAQAAETAKALSPAR